MPSYARLYAASNLQVGLLFSIYSACQLIASPILLISGVILFAGAGGLVENALRGLTSRMVGPGEQGRVSGAGQSVQSLAMILGPLFGGLVYTQLGHFQAYGSGALIIALAIASLVMAIPSLHKKKEVMETSG